MTYEEFNEMLDDVSKTLEKYNLQIGCVTGNYEEPSLDIYVENLRPNSKLKVWKD